MISGEGYVGSSAAETNIVPHEVVASSQESTVTCGNGQIIDLESRTDPDQDEQYDGKDSQINKRLSSSGKQPSIVDSIELP